MDRHELRRLRLARKLTQTELSKLATNDGGTVSQQMIDQMERGKRPIPQGDRVIGTSRVIEPSVHDELVEVLTEWDDEDIRAFLAEPPAPRGAYGRGKG